jgi:site-specific DNA-methyltransferase (cytosine-N4-specific)
MRQIDLFSEVLHSYAGQAGGRLANVDLYAQVCKRSGISAEEFEARVPVGRSGQKHNLLKRSLRWFQQDLRRAKILEHVEGARGVWQLTRQASDDLNEIDPGVALLAFLLSSVWPFSARATVCSPGLMLRLSFA